MEYLHHAKAPNFWVSFCVAETDENHARRKSEKKKREQKPRVVRARV